jgi:hypothetical protein
MLFCRKIARSSTALCAIAAVFAALPGCVSLSESMTGISTSYAEAFAVVEGRVLQGKAQLTAERSGSVQLQSLESPPLSCFGPLSYTSTTQGVISLSCSNGRSVGVSFLAFSPLSGAGRGLMDPAGTGAGAATETAPGAVSKVDFTLTYGLKADRAATYLAVPLANLIPLASHTRAMTPDVVTASP